MELSRFSNLHKRPVSEKVLWAGHPHGVCGVLADSAAQKSELFLRWSNTKRDIRSWPPKCGNLGLNLLVSPALSS